MYYVENKKLMTLLNVLSHDVQGWNRSITMQYHPDSRVMVERKESLNKLIDLVKTELHTAPTQPPTKMIVTKTIREGRKVEAKIGMILDISEDFKRIGGVKTLTTKSGRYICDAGSPISESHCEPYYPPTT